MLLIVASVPSICKLHQFLSLCILFMFLICVVSRIEHLCIQTETPNWPKSQFYGKKVICLHRSNDATFGQFRINILDVLMCI